MAEEFLSDSTGSACPNSEPAEPEREPVQLIVIGSHAGVNETVQTLYVKEFAPVDAWSPIQPAPNHPGEVMRILTRYRKRKSSDRKSGR